MGNFIRKNLATILILGATLILAGIAVFTAIRLYQLRQQPVAPTAPTSKPEAAAPVACQALTFTLAVATPTPTPTPLPGCYGTCTTAGSQSNCPSGMTCQTIGGNNICVNPSCASNSNCVCATPTPTPTPGTPNACGGTCGSDTNCQSGMVCYITSGTTGVCRNPSCLTSTNCVCGTPTPTPIALATPTPTPIPTAAPQLPKAGISTPTWIGVGVGSFLLIGAMLLAL